MTASDPFGQSVGPWAIEQAVKRLLQNPPDGQTDPLLVYYLADQERSTGLNPRTLPVPPGPSSYRGGVDADTFEPEWFPVVHVNVRPNGPPERIEMDAYGQRWEITVTATVGDDDEDTARMIAESYATAIELLVTQNASLGIGAASTVPTGAPDPQLLDPVSARQVCRTVVTFETLTMPALTAVGPVTFGPDPYVEPGAWPPVTSTDVTLDVVPVAT